MFEFLSWRVIQAPSCLVIFVLKTGDIQSFVSELVNFSRCVPSPSDMLRNCFVRLICLSNFFRNNEGFHLLYFGTLFFSPNINALRHSVCFISSVQCDGKDSWLQVNIFLCSGSHPSCSPVTCCATIMQCSFIIVMKLTVPSPPFPDLSNIFHAISFISIAQSAEHYKTVFCLQWSEACLSCQSNISLYVCSMV